VSNISLLQIVTRNNYLAQSALVGDINIVSFSVERAHRQFTSVYKRRIDLTDCLWFVDDTPDAVESITATFLLF